jgi:hypothetical protein
MQIKTVFSQNNVGTGIWSVASPPPLFCACIYIYVYTQCQGVSYSNAGTRSSNHLHGIHNCRHFSVSEEFTNDCNIDFEHLNNTEIRLRLERKKKGRKEERKNGRKKEKTEGRINYMFSLRRTRLLQPSVYRASLTRAWAPTEWKAIASIRPTLFRFQLQKLRNEAGFMLSQSLPKSWNNNVQSPTGNAILLFNVTAWMNFSFISRDSPNPTLLYT